MKCLFIVVIAMSVAHQSPRVDALALTNCRLGGQTVDGLVGEPVQIFFYYFILTLNNQLLLVFIENDTSLCP